ncbi:hypothetical protein A3A76_02745 [Candidatus Woesebacteria bacterium RIFCSPLOWO2_01_FULL_39_23]|uniref:Uncharacterized protein n=1 Tax=Candidatus Woesebacteria bacterium RIFCSPHIGHO2_01_FULL_40_22 TaxID=1802499 RepID=A0A1F7YJC6_9BACT|nr:MAG: hypothetical protein A2141_01275 [Candidatus Woesebacteria bacterium RBG_16_40_11]OGM27393.1 MAG: hypothetical protein A2628_01150 [Candidatus Woesebacteria bacterium RIFCSPHIGHO2_01_FULL_40_22]OGM36158.1 MAG: hypothetical protein A3E41_01430 [Candidatus Woesebacteria bacterium RIFCSPHIGHO2_12_FULL_38_9]OGM62565.1 MAG: hypothetical protein A3A76_02745 [Candidatus Woesebacteria bacterium RIFCSPLOWO2_01_FULL_39_23]
MPILSIIHHDRECLGGGHPITETVSSTIPKTENYEVYEKANERLLEILAKINKQPQERER